MKKFKNQNQKGITLVALVVTIVVLLILSGVSIVTLFGENGIITAAQKVAEQTKNGVNKDLEELKELEGMLTGWTSGKNEKGETIFTKGNTTLRIGDYINYDCASGAGADKTYTSYAYGKENNDHNGRTSGYNKDQTFKAKDYAGTNGKWRVLGAENGELEIIASASVPLTNGSNYWLGKSDSNVEYGKVAYQYGVGELNAISRIYGYGDNATGARSINVEDVNKITGYNPKNPANGAVAKYGAGSIEEYGNEVTYKWQGGTAPEYSYTKSDGTTVKNTLNEYHSSSGFTWYNEKTKKLENSPYTSTAQTNPITTLKSTFYFYYPNTLTGSESGETLGIETTSPEYKVIVTDFYWLASTFVITSTNTLRFGLFAFQADSIGGSNLLISRGRSSTGANGVRPVVSLKSDIKLEKVTTDSNGYTTWNIK